MFLESRERAQLSGSYKKKERKDFWKQHRQKEETIGYYQ